ncbi:acyl-CoA N-acyltransferase [Thozetella sp. PMI_491]|nr:acyl-CoA N-acyltransferase [Thozetella sp. PMI_491]
MAAKVYVRHATEDELTKLADIGSLAFKHNPQSELVFPERLRVKPGNQDEIEFRVGRWKKLLPEPTSHFLTAVEAKPDGTEELIGMALWTSPPEPGKEPTEEEKEKKKKEASNLPPFVDREAVTKLRESMQNWETSLLGEEGTKNYWVLQAIAVHPGHQRKGAGRMLVQWGIDEATKNGLDVWLIATPDGRKLYTSMDFEYIAERVELGEIQTAMKKKLQAAQE